MRNPDADAPPPGTRYAPRGERGDRLTREWTLDQQFWQLWRAGQRPDPRTFLAGRTSLTPAAVAAVLSIDQYERWLSGERTPAEEYVALVPEGPDRNQAVCDLVYGEYLLREQLGEHPDAAEYRRRFPAEAALFDRQLELHQVLALEPVPPPSRSRALRTPTPTQLGGPTRETIPGYELLEEIGRGGMGVVYRARQLNLDRMVALKVLPLGPVADLDDRGALTGVERMRREAQVMARLSHPNIVTVFDAGSTATSFYLAMEYVPGQDLHRLVEQAGPLPIETACDYMRQAALGLQHAHAAGLVHRDIKPSNLIVAGADPTQQGTLKILDLGLARLVAGPGSAQATITHVGTFMGTPDFIAPEQANDPRTADHRSDLYSLGCAFFFVLTGQPPFSGATPLAKLMHHHLTTAPDPREVRPDIPDWLAELFRRLLAKRPEDRPQTAAEVAAALARGAAPGTEAPLPSPSPSHRPGLLRRLPGHTDWVKGLAFSPDGSLLASVSLDRTLRLWDFRAGDEVGRSLEQCGGLLCLAFAPGGGAIAAAGEEGVIGLWEAATRRPRWQVRCHGSNLNCLSFDDSGQRLLSGGHDGVLRLWDPATGVQVRQWTGHSGAVWGAALSHDGRLAITGGQDRALRLWETATGESLVVLPEQPMLVTCLALSPSGNRLLTGGVDGVIHVWDLAASRKVGALEGHAARVTALAFSPDGREVASSSRDQSVRIWRLDPGRELHRFDEQTRWVSAVAWSPDGRFVASGGTDRSICVYSVRP